MDTTGDVLSQNTIDYRYIDEFPCDPPSSIFLVSGECNSLTLGHLSQPYLSIKEPTNANGEDPDGDVSTLDLDFQPARQSCRDKAEKHPLVLPLVIVSTIHERAYYAGLHADLPGYRPQGQEQIPSHKKIVATEERLDFGEHHSGVQKSFYEKLLAFPRHLERKYMMDSCIIVSVARLFICIISECRSFVLIMGSTHFLS